MKGHLPALSIDRSIFFHIINFIILYYLFKKLFFPKIQNILDDRKNKIEKSLKIAEEIKKESKIIREKADKDIIESHKISNDMVKQSYEKANIMKQELLEEANKLRKDMILDTEKQIELMKINLKEDIRKDSIKIGVKIAEKILKQNTNIENYIEDLEKISLNLEDIKEDDRC